MTKSDVELIRNSLRILNEGQTLDEAKPMGLLKSLNLQVQRAFNKGGADTQLWSGNYANSIYSEWNRQAEPGSTGEDFIGWYTRSEATSNVQRIEDSFIKRIVFKAMNGKINEPITREQVSKIAHDLATITARQHLGMTHKLTSASSAEQRDQAIEILKEFIPFVHKWTSTGQLSFKKIYDYLNRKMGRTPAVRTAFRQYSKLIQSGKLQLAGITPAEFNPTNAARINDPAKINAIIPMLDDFVLACVINSKAPSPPPPPTPLDPASYAAEFARWQSALTAAGVTFTADDIKKLVDRALGI